MRKFTKEILSWMESPAEVQKASFRISMPMIFQFTAAAQMSNEKEIAPAKHSGTLENLSIA